LFYPPEWEGLGSLFFDDVQSCCEFFRPGEDCKVYDICSDEDETVLEAPKCTSNAYHPDIENKDGCSNSIDGYPPEWDEQREMYFYDSALECCSFFFAANPSECKVYKVCDEGVPSLNASTSPPKRPTTSPTQPPTITASPTTPNPTTSPSTSPSHSPSTSPSIAPIRYYIVFSTGICTPLDAFTPYWYTEDDFYVDYNVCCSESWNTDACLAASPAQNSTQ
jgi:hypothetical protein